MNNHYVMQFVLPVARAAVFDYLADARNLDGLTPHWLGFDVRTPTPIDMDVGTIVDYRLRWRRMPLVWRSEIVEWSPRASFTYEQRRGPYRHFRHLHRFEETAEGTLITDEVWWNVWGACLLRRWVDADLDAIFRVRVARLASAFGRKASSVVVRSSVHESARQGLSPYHTDAER